MGNMRKRAEWVAAMKEAADKILKIDEELESLKAFEPPERIAIVLHDLICRHNHTDGCSWFYELKDKVHDWEKAEHKDWLKRVSGLRNSLITTTSLKSMCSR